jgi:hypothetical protein
MTLIAILRMRAMEIILEQNKQGLVTTNLRGCPQAHFFSHKNIKTYFSCQKKGTFRGLPGVALSRG